MSQFNPYAPPQAHPTYPGAPYGGMGGAMHAGDSILVPKGTMFPAVCVKCGRSHDLTSRTETFTWAPQWVFLMFLISWLIVIIAYLVTRKTAAFVLPLCNDCNRAWTEGKRLVLWVALGCIVVTVLASFAVGAAEPDLIGLPIGLGLLTAIIAPLIVSLVKVKPRTIWVKRIDNVNANLCGIHPEAAQALLGAGGATGGYGPPPGYGAPQGYGPPPGQW